MLFSPPIQQPLVDPKTGLVSREWNLFFQGLAKGDPGAIWVPTYTSRTLVGSVADTGKWFQFGRYQAYFSATITSVAGGTSASVAGTTYINNFPANIQGDSVILAANSTTNIGLGTGLAKASNQRIYLPAWAATTNTITITGIVETN